MLEGDLSERAICLRGRFVLEGESSVYRLLYGLERFCLRSNKKGRRAMRGCELQLNKYGAGGVYSCVWAGLVKDGVPCMIFTATTDHCLLYILIEGGHQQNAIFFETVSKSHDGGYFYFHRK